MNEIVLRYIGDGSFLLDVPARDLNKTDLEKLAGAGLGETELILSGLYEKAKSRGKAVMLNDQVTDITKGN